MAAGFQRGASPTQITFQRLLGWLDEGIDSGGERYLEVRRRLVQYFGRKNCLHPDELADETLNRVARRLEEEGGIADTPPARYCYIAARFVFLEYRRTPGQVSIETRSELAGECGFGGRDSNEDAATRLHCLDCCLARLRPEDRDVILEYYRGDRREKIDRRRNLASKLGVSVNALTIRACRIRDRLEECVRGCCGNE